MNRSKLVAVGFAAALALSVAPAFAQHRRNGGDGEQRRDNAAAPRTENRQESRSAPGAPPQQQQQAPQPQQRQREEPRAVPRQEPRQDQRAVPREEIRRSPQYAVPREQYAAPRQQPQYATPRSAAPRYDNRYDNRSYDNRSYDNRSYNNRSYDNRCYDSGRYSSGGRYYGPRYSGPRFSIAPRRFYRPYYVFRPRISIGFGIWAGFPVTYYDPYYYPYDYYPSYPYASTGPGYPPPLGSVGVQPYGQPSQGNMGGLSFDISPDDAEVWVDGNYAGVVGDFTASSQPLGLPAGRHHLELREPDFQVSSFDVDIIAGQVIPFQGQLQQ